MALLDTLRARGLPHTTYPLRAVPSTELLAAQRELDQAITALRKAELERKVTSELKAVRRAAQDKLDTCYVALTLRAMPPDELEALLAEHKPTEEEREEGQPFHRKTFAPALLARCVYDDQDAPEPAMTAEQWTQEISKGSMSLGETAALFWACWQINDRTPDPDSLKG